MPKPKILIIDDEAAVRFGVREFFEHHGYDVEEADSCRGAEEVFQSTRPDAVILDFRLPDGSALELMARLKAIDSGVPVVILTGHGSIDLAVQAIKEGAEQFLTKPVELASLLVMLKRLLLSQRDRQRRLAGQVQEARHGFDPFAGSSAAIRGLAEQAERVARSESPILIQGATGTGKGILARWLHERSARAEEALVDLNCAGLNRDFLESELFGHEKGAFTGAVSSKPGLLEIGHRGTVFLDEIGDVHPEVQPKLLKVLEEKRFRRMGEVRDRRVDIRLIVATHRDLPLLIRQERFRSDLYFRISTIPLRVPSLAERPEDILPLAESLVRRLGRDLGRSEVRLAPAAADALVGYPWPGNIRELRNVLERAVLLTRRETIEPSDLHFDLDLLTGREPAEASLTLLELERRHIERVLLAEGGHVERAARRLGVPRSTLYQKLKRFGIRLSETASW